MAAVQSLPVIVDSLSQVEPAVDPTVESTEDEEKAKKDEEEAKALAEEERLWREEVNRVKAPQEFKHHFVFKAEMSCGGCSGAIDRKLNNFKTHVKAESQDKVYHEVSLEKQTAHVFTNNTELDAIFELIAGTKKKVLRTEEVDENGNKIKSITTNDKGARLA